MPGGLLQIVSSEMGNVVTAPTINNAKSYWKTGYKQSTNFAKQRFRLDYEGTPTLSLTADTTFTFKVKRYADLLTDCYICIDLPTIWSPIYPPQMVANEVVTSWVPYEFQWIRNIGTQIIRQVTIQCGNQQLQKYSGQYIQSVAQRDYPFGKKKVFDEMIGNVPQCNDPANYGSRVNTYPNACFTESMAGAEPSIYGRTLYIPLGAWFCEQTSQSIPLASLQYNEITISVAFRPLQEWFVIRDVQDYVNNYPYVAPNFNKTYMQLHRFLQTPPNQELQYTDLRTSWASNIHLSCTYCFLSTEEQRIFSRYPQSYLIKQVSEQYFYNITGQSKINLNSLGVVSGWMFYLQRSDIMLRNQWSNYTNYPYEYVPQDVMPAPTLGVYPNPSQSIFYPYLGEGLNPDGTLSGLFVTGNYNPSNLKYILTNMGILLNGEYRENILPSPVYQFTEKFKSTENGLSEDGMYYYNFSNSPSNLGGINMSSFSNVQLELATILPPNNPHAQVLTICDSNTGNIVGINKASWQIYEYNYNLCLMEERYNVITFESGSCGVQFAL